MSKDGRPVRLAIQVLWAPPGTPTELIMDIPKSSWELMSWEANRKKIALPALWRSWINPHVRRVRSARQAATTSGEATAETRPHDTTGHGDRQT